MMIPGYTCEIEVDLDGAPHLVYGEILLTQVGYDPDGIPLFEETVCARSVHQPEGGTYAEETLSVLPLTWGPVLVQAILEEAQADYEDRQERRAERATEVKSQTLTVTFHMEPADRGVGIMSEGFSAWVGDDTCILSDLGATPETSLFEWESEDRRLHADPLTVRVVQRLLHAFAESFYAEQRRSDRIKAIVAETETGPSEDCPHDGGTRGGICDQCGAEL